MNAAVGVAAIPERSRRGLALATLSRTIGRHPLLLLYGLALVPLLLLGVRQPVWSLVDESAHYDYVAQLAHGVVPVHGTLIRPETLSVMEQTGIYRFYLDVPQPQPATVFSPPTGSVSAAAWSLWDSRHTWQQSAEAGTLPFYYAASVPVWWLGDAAGGAMGAVFALRIEDAVLAALLAPLLYLTILEVMPRRREIAAWVAVLSVSLPGVVMSLTGVSNVTLVTVAATGLLLVCMRSLTQGWSRRRVLTAAALTALACATKSIAPALAPAVLVALLWGWRSDGLRAVASRVLLVGGAAVLSMVPSYVMNHLTGLTASSALSTATPPALHPVAVSVDAAFHSVDNAVLTFVSGEPLGVLLPPAVPLLALLGVATAGLAAMGLLRRRRAKVTAEDSVRRSQVVVLGIALLGQSGLAVIYFLRSSNAFPIPVPGRYIYPALAAVAVLLALALHRTRLSRQRLRIGALLILSVAMATLTVYPARLNAAVSRHGAGQPQASIQRVRLDGATASANGFSVTADSRADDTDGTWVHLIVGNAGAGIVEWLPMATATANGSTIAVTDYRASGALPEQMAVGATSDGWLKLQTVNGGVLPAAFTLTFPDVATHAYQDLRSLVIGVSTSR